MTLLTEEKKEEIYNAWRDAGDDESYGDLMDRVQQAVLAEVAGKWKLVPVEPTQEMCQAAVETPGMVAFSGDAQMTRMRQHQEHWATPYPGEGTVLEQVWRAMLAAAPSLPEVGE